MECNRIEDICEIYRIFNWTVSDGPDGYVVDIDGDVSLRAKHLNEIPFKFGEVRGYFNISNNNLSSLKNSPDSCSDFIANDNELTSLKYSPEYCYDYYVSGNRLKNLKGIGDVSDLMRVSDNRLLFDINDLKFDNIELYWTPFEYIYPMIGSVERLSYFNDMRVIMKNKFYYKRWIKFIGGGEFDNRRFLEQYWDVVYED